MAADKRVMGGGSSVAPEIPIVGASAPMAKAIRTALGKYPGWFVRAARISKIIVVDSPQTRDQIAVYEHGSRTLSVLPRVGDLLQKALGHELAHGVDDNFGSPHYFTSTYEWRRIHREQPHFDIPKYETEALEYFADMVTKIFLLGPQKLRITNSREVIFITGFVFPKLQQEFA